MDALNGITLEQVKELMPEKVSLVYVDYNDSLDGHDQLVQDCIHAGNLDSLYENIDEWYQEAEWHGQEEVFRELAEDTIKKYDLEDSVHDVKEGIKEAWEDELRELMYDRLDDDTLKDLIRNTTNPTAHYDTGYYMESESWSWSEARVRLERMKIKKHLSITSSDYDKCLDIMIMQAGYGGGLFVYFKLDLDDFLKVPEGTSSITFNNAHIGIVNHGNGSGDITDLPKHKFTLPFNRENVFLEKTIHYNWTYSIAGMTRDWCDSTDVTLGTEEVEGEIETSSTNDLLEQEKKYNETYRAGSCTYGDTNIDRHRNTKYVNEVPCGTHCPHCGQFWID